MRKFTLFLFLFILIKSVYADWELFPLRQKSIYSYQNSFTQEKFISSFSMDTIVNRGTYSVYYFNRNHTGVSFVDEYYCFRNVDSPDIVNYLPHGFEYDSLYFYNDTIRLNANTYFLPKATPGQSWTCNTHLIKCDSIGYLQFVGTADSVKYFSSGSLRFVLSKNHGFVEFIPLRFMSFNFQLFQRTLIGFEDSSGQYGFNTPTYLDYFPYQVGDILYWKYSDEPFNPQQGQVILSKDSITNIIISPDSIYILSDRSSEYQDGTTSFSQYFWNYRVSDLINLLEAPTNWFGMKYTRFFGDIGIHSTSEYIVEDDSSLTYKNTDHGIYFTGITACSISVIPDVAYHLTFNTKRGFIEWRSDYFHPIMIYETLIGSILGGVADGDTSFHVDVEKISKENFVHIFPNPSHDYLQLKSIDKIKGIKIFNLLGSVLFEGHPHQNEIKIETAEWPSSIYLIRLEYEGGVFMERKFIRQ